MLREIVLFYPEVTRILCVEMIKSCKSSQHTEPSPVLLQTKPQPAIDYPSTAGCFSFLQCRKKREETLSASSFNILTSCICLWKGFSQNDYQCNKNNDCSRKDKIGEEHEDFVEIFMGLALFGEYSDTFRDQTGSTE